MGNILKDKPFFVICGLVSMLAGCAVERGDAEVGDMTQFQDRSFVVAAASGETIAKPVSASNSLNQHYEYRGGRDPVTGSAYRQH